MTDNDDDEVGYGKPPKKHQFQKGQSGNPRGRPKKKRPEAIDITSALNAPVTATIEGVKRKISSFEASCRQLSKKALAGDVGAAIKFIKLCEENGLIVLPTPIQGGGVLIAPKGVDFQDWAESVELELLENKLRRER
jgi:Family of unknown function (DUF5681)